MRLQRLTLKNFKGIREFTLDAQGGNVDVFGDNATGKTTLFDAFTWLLFDKDSSNKKDFSIKTLDKSGAEQHGLEHEVEATLDIDGQEITLRKVYKEKWTKKRGSAQAVFTGHTTDYYIDSVPVKKSEYEARIAEIADEGVFKLLTSPTYFNEQLHWEKRRQILLEVCGDLTDEEVISSNKALAELPKILGNHSLEDYRKIIAARRAKINDELKKIPVRIDEVTQGLPDLSSFEGNDLQADIDSLHEKIREKEQELSRIESGGEIAEKRVQLREVESDLISLKNQLQGKISEQIEAKRRELQQLKSNIYDLQSEARNKKDALNYCQQQIAKFETEMATLREKWHQVNNEQFRFEQSDECPTCGQSLPTEKLNAAREKALARFNRDKAEKLEAISAQGKEYKEAVEALKAELQPLNDAIAQAEAKAEEYSQKANELELVIENMMKDAGTYKEDPAYIAKLAEKERLESEITQLQQNANEAKQKVINESNDLNTSLRFFERALAQTEQHKQGLKRIEELKQQERDLSAEYERLEGELYLTEEFIRTKVNLLEEKINSRFKLARFKLFNTLVNGGVEECCETLYQGVPYSGGLNNAARINVGLDIINTLSEHYGFEAPIFVDNAEAVTKLIETKGQVIRLVVSEQDKKLRVECENVMREAV
ncbi:MAG: AAA family ATPase [Fastidiosipilaceae bacterium]